LRVNNIDAVWNLWYKSANIVQKIRATLKRYFIPNEGNDNKPQVLRVETALIIFSIILLIEIAFLTQTFLILRHTDFLASILSNVLIDQTNLERESVKISSLGTNAQLEEAARLKVQDMATKGYFAHNTPEGHDPWYWLYQAGYDFVAAGENLAVNFTDSQDVTNAWMESSGHRANILNQDFTDVGIATARGEYKGRDTVFVVQFFGTPSTAIAGGIPPKQSVEMPVPTPDSTLPAEETEIVFEPQEPIVSQESFIQVERIELADGRGIIASKQANIIEEIASEPRATANYLLLLLTTIIIVALLLAIFVNIKVQHPPLIANGVALLLIMSSAILANEYLSTLGLSVL